MLIEVMDIFSISSGSLAFNTLIIVHRSKIHRLRLNTFLELRQHLFVVVGVRSAA